MEFLRCAKRGVNSMIEGSTGADLNGAQTKVTGSAMAEVTGGVVKVNQIKPN